MKNYNRLIAGMLAFVVSAASTGMMASADKKDSDKNTSSAAASDSKDTKDKKESPKVTMPTVTLNKQDGIEFSL